MSRKNGKPKPEIVLARGWLQGRFKWPEQCKLAVLHMAKFPFQFGQERYDTRIKIVIDVEDR